jgi:hypothetical protein
MGADRKMEILKAKGMLSAKIAKKISSLKL